CGFRARANLAPRLGQVFVYVGAQGAKRGDVNDPHLIRQRTFKSFAEEIVDPTEKRRQRLARACGGRDERGGAALDRFPPRALRRGGFANSFPEPARNNRMETLHASTPETAI